MPVENYRSPFILLRQTGKESCRNPTYILSIKLYVWLIKKDRHRLKIFFNNVSTVIYLYKTLKKFHPEGRPHSWV